MSTFALGFKLTIAIGHTTGTVRVKVYHLDLILVCVWLSIQL